MNKYKIYAHRGYSAKYPENTILSFQKAFEAGADGVECDIQKTGDGCYVVIHDDVLDRVSKNKTGFVNEMTLSDIKDCDLGSGQTVPELSEFLMSIPHNVIINIELKSETLTEADCPEILRILVKYMKKENVLISSFEPSFLPYFRKNGISTGLLVGDKSIIGIITDIIKTNPEYLNLPVLMFEYIGFFFSMLFIRIMKLFGKKIIFYTVNTTDELEKSAVFSNTFITDNVESVISYLKNR